MKKCTLCHKLKAESEFNKRKASKDGLQNKCRECSKSFCQQHYSTNKEYYASKRDCYRQDIKDLIAEVKADLVCIYCGEGEDCCLDFHHRDPRKKDFNIGLAVNEGYSKQKILDELEKCDCVCSNCHRKIHAGVLAGDVMVA